MIVLISGEAGLLGVLGETPELRSVEGEIRSGLTESDVHAAFRTCGDVQRRVVETLKQAEGILKQAWNLDRAIRILAMMLDPEEPQASARKSAELVERFLHGPLLTEAMFGIVETVLRRDEINIKRVRSIVKGLPLTSALLGIDISDKFKAHSRDVIFWLEDNDIPQEDADIFLHFLNLRYEMAVLFASMPMKSEMQFLSLDYSKESAYSVPAIRRDSRRVRELNFSQIVITKLLSAQFSDDERRILLSVMRRMADIEVKYGEETANIMLRRCMQGLGGWREH